MATQPPLTDEAIAAAVTRYSTTFVLRTLLTWDPVRRGIPIRLLRARWVLEHFQAAGNEAVLLEHRQALERAHGDTPFASGQMLERVLSEVGSGNFAFPSIFAMSHM